MHPLLFFESAKALIPWNKVAIDYFRYLSYFAIFGALGFRFLALRRTETPRATADAAGSPKTFRAVAERSAARIGLIGALLLVIVLCATAVRNAAAARTGVFQWALGVELRVQLQFACGLLFPIAFALALRRRRGAWAAAALVAVVYTLRNSVTGQWTRLVNPFHEIAASLWLGTLFVLVAAGPPAILLSADQREHRGKSAIELVSRFSPLALCAAAILGVTGIITVWLHLKYVAALWTTSYGYALDAKLVVVAVVIALGAWNWRRLTPKLGTEEATHALRRSSTMELVFAGVVLLLTAVLVSLPTPKLPAP